MGQGPYGPRALGPGPFLVGRTPHQKTHPGKKNPKCVFWVFFGNKKDAGRPYDHFPLSIAPRSLLCVRKRRFPFLKKDIILSVICQFVNSPPGAGCERTPFAIKGTLTRGEGANPKNDKRKFSEWNSLWWNILMVSVAVISTCSAAHHWAPSGGSL